MSNIKDLESAPEEKPESGRNRLGLVLRIIVLAGVAAAFGTLYYFFREQLSLDYLAARESELRDFQARHPVAIYAAAFVLYVLVTALSLPGAAVMTVAYGWLFDFLPAVILISFASTSGATLAFLLSRYLIGGGIQRRYGERLSSFNEALEREGAFYLFTLRLIPAVPFFVINVVMGLTRIRVRTFWWVSQLGMLPGTCVYVFAGSAVPTLKQVADEGMGSILSWPLIAAFVALGVFPLVVKKVVDAVRSRRSTAPSA